MVVRGSQQRQSTHHMKALSTQTWRNRRRRGKGSAIAEFGPALFILFFCALFPAIDLIGMGVGYLSCVSLNNLQLREAVRLPKSQATDPKGTVMLTIPQNWRPTLMGGFAGLVEDPTTQLIYTPAKGYIYVTVSTTCAIRPLVPIPFFPGVPGLNAPFVTTVSHDRVLENPSFSVN